MNNLIFKKSNYAFEKYNDKYLVILNINHNALFVYHKDVKIVWDLINGKKSLENVFNNLIELGYKIEEKEIYNIIENLSKNGLLICDNVEEDLEHIKNNDQLENYCKDCLSQSLPTSLHIETSNECNLKCIHCFHDEEYNRLSFEEIDKLFEGLRNSQFVKVTLTGGEFTILPYWREIVKSAKRNGLIISILSNFTLMDYDDVDFIADSNVYSIKTSLYGSKAEIHEKITKVKGSFEKTIKILNYMVQKKIPAEVSWTIMKNNIEEISGIKDIMNELGVNISFDYRIFPSRTNAKNIKVLSISNEDFKRFAEHGLFNEPEKISCSACRYRIRISQTGEIYSCEALSVSLGNIRKDDLLEVLKGEKIKELSSKIQEYNPEECNSCKYDKYCTRCPALVWSTHPYENIHSEILCQHTRVACG